MTADRIDLGGGHYLDPIVHHQDPGRVAGYIETHPRPDTGAECSGFVAVDPESPQPVWVVVDTDPITLSPSIRCRTCGAHGWVRDGAWIDA